MGVEVGSHRVGEPDDRVLRQVVEEVAAVAERVAVGDLDDEPGVAFDHQRHAVPAGDDVAVDGALQHLHPPGGGELPEGRSPLGQRVAAPDVVDQDIEPTRVRADAGKELLDLRLDRVVGADGNAPATLRRDQLGRLLQRLRPSRGGGPAPHAATGAVYGGTRSAQHAGDTPAGTARRTGNDGHLISKRTVRHFASFDVENQNDRRPGTEDSGPEAVVALL